MAKTLRIVVLSSVLALGVTGIARADFPPNIPDKFQFELGGTFAQIDSTASLGTKGGGVAATINFSDIFDLPVNNSAPRLDGFWRMSGRSYLDFGYVEYNQSGARQIEQDVDFGGDTLGAGATVTAFYDTSFPYAAYRYDFLQHEDVHISGSAGLSWITMSTGLSTDGTFTINGVQQTGDYSKSVRIGFPVPLVGLRVDWALGHQWAVEFWGRAFYINYSGYKGGMQESSVRLRWHFSRHVGVAIGYDKEAVVLRQFETSTKSGSFGYQTAGISGFLLLTF
jgi:hypothetical protein